MPKFILALVFFSLSFGAFTDEHSFSSKKNLADVLLIEDKARAVAELESFLINKNLSAREYFDAVFALAKLKAEQGYFDKALTLFNQAKRLSAQNNWLGEEANVSKMIGIYHYYKGEHELSIKAYMQSLIFFREESKYIEEAHLLNNIALANVALGNRLEALKNYKLASSLYEQYGEKQDQVDVRYNMAGIYVRLKQIDIAMPLLEEIIGEMSALGDAFGVASAKGDLGLLYKNAGQYQRAESYMLAAIKYFQKENINHLASLQMCNISGLYLIQGNIEQATYYAHSGTHLADGTGQHRTTIACHINLSLAYYSLNEYEQAKDHFELANDASRGLNDDVSLTVLTGVSALIQANEGLSDKAVESFLQYRIKVSQQFSQDLSHQLASYESDLLTQKIEQLNREKALQKTSEFQKFALIIMILLLIFVVVLFFYKRHIDGNLKSALELRVKERTMELQAANNKLTTLSLLDGLTSVFNRRCFDRDIKNVWLDAKEGRGQFLLLLADVDHFKLYNDHYGHVAGDEVLKKIAQVINRYSRQDDRIYRYGGEEFAIIFTHHNTFTAKEIFERIKNEILALNIEHIKSEHLNITLSAGMAESSEQVSSIEELVQLADQRLYEAKGLGRNRLIEKKAC